MLTYERKELKRKHFSQFVQHMGMLDSVTGGYLWQRIQSIFQGTFKVDPSKVLLWKWNERTGPEQSAAEWSAPSWPPGQEKGICFDLLILILNPYLDRLVQVTAQSKFPI
jgi:hypothetical protein